MRLTQELLRHRQVEDPTPFFKIVTAERAFERAVEDLNPRHQVLETCVLPTELTAHFIYPLSHCWPMTFDLGGRNLSGRSAALRVWLCPLAHADRKASLFLLYLGVQP